MAFHRDAARNAALSAIYDVLKVAAVSVWVLWMQPRISGIASSMNVPGAVAWGSLVSILFALAGLFLFDWWRARETNAAPVAEPVAQPGVFSPTVTQLPPITGDDLVKSVYGRHVGVSLASVFSDDDSKYVEFSFFGFNGSRERISVRVEGKLLYDAWAVIPWTTHEPREVEPLSEFLVGVRMVPNPEMATKIKEAIEAGSRVEFGLSRLHIIMTTAGGANGRLDKPAAVQCFKGIQVSRTIAAKAELTIGKVTMSGGLSPQK